ncbi:unnamed protein product [Mytilus coruscus]|uniref:Uncharacterized protein n=1 Tax=Mytilus coruscus TaxID=42192 RepID=A0A6J8DYK1_MYTCO|nr:unnamed protein product [Mytilus coruscus]
MDNILDEPVVSSDTSSFHEDYKDDQVRYSQENVNIEPHTIAYKITDRDIQSQTSTEKVSNIKEREKAHTSTKDRKILTSRHMVPTDEKKERDSGLKSSKQAFEDTAKYNRKMDKITDEPVISSDTSSFYEHYKDNQERYSQENVNIEHHTITDKSTDSDIQSQTSTEQITSLKEREKAHATTIDRKMLMKRDIVTKKEMNARSPRLITKRVAVNNTDEYTSIKENTKTNVSDTETDQKRHTEVNINLKRHTLIGQITDSDNQYEPVTEKTMSIKERIKALYSIPIDRKTVKKKNILSRDEKKARAPCLITPKPAVEYINENNTLMAIITDKPVMSGGNIISDKDDKKYYGEENVNLGSHTFSGKLTDSVNQSLTSTEKITSNNEGIKALTSTADRMISSKRDIVLIDEKNTRTPRVITREQPDVNTTKYSTATVSISNEPMISSDSSSLYEDFKDANAKAIVRDDKIDQKYYSKGNVNLKTLTFDHQITDSDNQSQISTGQLPSIKERIKALTSTVDRKSLTKTDMVFIDEKKARPPGLMTLKQAFDINKEYKSAMVNISDEPVISSNSRSFHKDFKIENTKCIVGDTKDDQEYISKENINFQPHTSYFQITDSDNQSQTFTERITNKDERIKADTSAVDIRTLTKRDMVSIEEMKTRAPRVMTLKPPIEAFELCLKPNTDNTVSDNISSKFLGMNVQTASEKCKRNEENDNVAPKEISELNLGIGIESSCEKLNEKPFEKIGTSFFENDHETGNTCLEKEVDSVISSYIGKTKASKQLSKVDSEVANDNVSSDHVFKSLTWAKKTDEPSVNNLTKTGIKSNTRNRNELVEDDSFQNLAMKLGFSPESNYQSRGQLQCDPSFEQLVQDIETYWSKYGVPVEQANRIRYALHERDSREALIDSLVTDFQNLVSDTNEICSDRSFDKLAEDVDKAVSSDSSLDSLVAKTLVPTETLIRTKGFKKSTVLWDLNEDNKYPFQFIERRREPNYIKKYRASLENILPLVNRLAALNATQIQSKKLNKPSYDKLQTTVDNLAKRFTEYTEKETEGTQKKSYQCLNIKVESLSERFTEKDDNTGYLSNYQKQQYLSTKQKKPVVSPKHENANWESTMRNENDTDLDLLLETERRKARQLVKKEIPTERSNTKQEADMYPKGYCGLNVVNCARNFESGKGISCAVHDQENLQRSFEHINIKVDSISKAFTPQNSKLAKKPMNTIHSLKDLNIGVPALIETFDANKDETVNILPDPYPKDTKFKNIITTPRGFSA